MGRRAKNISIWPLAEATGQRVCASGSVSPPRAGSATPRVAAISPPVNAAVFRKIMRPCSFRVIAVRWVSCLVLLLGGECLKNDGVSRGPCAGAGVRQSLSSASLGALMLPLGPTSEAAPGPAALLGLVPPAALTSGAPLESGVQLTALGSLAA